MGSTVAGPKWPSFILDSEESAAVTSNCKSFCKRESVHFGLCSQQPEDPQQSYGGLKASQPRRQTSQKDPTILPLPHAQAAILFHLLKDRAVDGCQCTAAAVGRDNVRVGTYTLSRHFNPPPPLQPLSSVIVFFFRHEGKGMGRARGGGRDTDLEKRFSHLRPPSLHK